MKNPSHTPTVDALLAESKWMHGLSRSLVIDAASADDLVQDALAAATGYHGPRPSDPRNWATAVLKNLARDRARGRSRRSRRETESAQPESNHVDPSSAVEAAECQRVLLDAVLSLDEPYRTVIVMRWFDNLSVRAIAREKGRPVETVKKQLQRAHVQLRQKLESKYGGDGAWAVAMLPLAAVKKTGLLSVSALSVAAAVAVTVGGTILALPKGADEPLPSPDARTALAASKDPDGGGAMLPLDEKGDRLPTRSQGTAETAPQGHGPSTEAAFANPKDPALPTPHFRGRLFDPSGIPITSTSAPSLRLRLTPRPGTTGVPSFSRPILLAPDAEGRVMSVEVPSALTEFARVTVDGDRLAVLAVGWTESIEDEAQVVLMPAVTLAGTVIDGEGNPISGAQVSLNANLEALGSYPLALEELSPSMRYSGQWSATTDVNGRFQLEDIPAKDRFVLEARTNEGARGETRARSVDTQDLIIRVEDWRGAPTAVTGRVLDDRGSPVPGETVRLSSAAALTGNDGRFEISVGVKELAFIHRQSRACLWIRAKNGSFATLDLDPENRGPYVLRLPTEMGSIRGLLKDASGKPVFRAKVCLLDGTRTPSRSTPLESLDGSGPCITDRDGSFEIGNLLDRDYTLRFIGEDSALVFDVQAVTPNEAKRDFIIPEDHFQEGFKGRCMDLMGRPLAGLRVSLKAAQQGPSDFSTAWSTTGETVTDGRGEFTFDKVSREGLIISFDPNIHDGQPGQQLNIEELDPTGSLPIELDLDCSVHLSQAPGSPIAKVQFLDAAGERVSLCEIRANSFYYSSSMRPTEDGTYFPCMVPQSSRWLETLDANGDVLSKTELELHPMTVNELML